MPENLIIGSYNLRTHGGRDPFPNDWESRMPRIRADIARAGYHIWGAQETCDFYAANICQGNSFVSIGHGRDENAAGEACHIYYDSERLEVLRHETFWLSSEPEKCSTVPGAIYPRICTAGIFRDKVSKREFIFANTHLEHRVLEVQKKQLEYLFAHLGNDEKRPLILTGDFNAFPDTPAVCYAMEMLHDARNISRTPVTYQGPTYHGFISSPAERTHTDRIDYIFVSDGVTVERFDVTDNFTGPDTASSDHFPLRAEISFAAAGR